MNVLFVEVARAIQEDREREIQELIRFAATRPSRKSRRLIPARRRARVPRIRPAV